MACVKNVDGIKVIYVKSTYSNYMSIPRKLWSFANFIRLAIKKASKQKEVDMVFATSTPLTVGYIALRLKKKWGGLTYLRYVIFGRNFLFK